MLLPRNKISLEQFLPHVMAMVQGDSRSPLAPAVALSYLRRSAIAFCQQTGIIRPLVKVRPQNNVSTYPIVHDENIWSITEAFVGDPDKCYRCTECVCSFEDDCITFCCPFGDNSDDVHVRVTTYPSATACEVDQILFDEWHDAIVAGALQHIHKMPQQPWTSGGASILNAELFIKEVARARHIVMRKRVGGPQRVKANSRYVSSGPFNGGRNFGGW